ncbi:trypsin-like serine protease [Planosporangium thailandense]|uniref:Trypsin-like serine protease n=1 Tax=Planosporangium thailandense TaxID=765197 RepID=A0ABX0XW62_9ACTN|nr:trypsin-like peptidase domain-containing protein [Planosporangium thailandense]NJC70281.1 trypsin-like serine protease [Planosporangium thailandense]
MTPIEPAPEQPGGPPTHPASPRPEPPAGFLPRWMPNEPYLPRWLPDQPHLPRWLPDQPYRNRPVTAAPAGRWRARLATGLVTFALMVCAGVTGGYVAHRMDLASPLSTSFGASATGVVERYSLAAVAAAVQPSVVSIDAGAAEGSGIILNTDGYVLTNNHVVSMARGRSVQLTFAGGRTATAGIVGADTAHDVAVVRASGVPGLSAAKFGDSQKVQVGDTVLAIGSPLGLQGTVTAGIVSALHRDLRAAGRDNSTTFSISDAIQTDAAINPGNSGGALVDRAGRVVGVNTAIATAGQSDGNIGVGFAIPSNAAKRIADRIMTS